MVLAWANCLLSLPITYSIVLFWFGHSSICDALGITWTYLDMESVLQTMVEESEQQLMLPELRQLVALLEDSLPIGSCMRTDRTTTGQPRGNIITLYRALFDTLLNKYLILIFNN